MPPCFDQLYQLCDILDAELDGRPVDRDLAHELATSLAADYPDIAVTLRRIAERMVPPSLEANAA